MLQVPYLRENTEKALSGLAKRNKDFSATVESIISVDESRRKLQNELDNLLAESNKISKVIGDLFKEGKREEDYDLIKKTGTFIPIGSMLRVGDLAEQIE